MSIEISNYLLEAEVEGGELVNTLNVSNYLLEVEVWEAPLYDEPEVNSFNIYLGTAPINKIYLGSTDITNAIY